MQISDTPFLLVMSAPVGLSRCLCVGVHVTDNYRGLKNYQHHFGGFLILKIVDVSINHKSLF